jgi:hypothetical protein
MTRAGILLGLLPVLCWSWQLRDPCGLQGEAWLQCRAHHQGEHRQPVQ